jgi:putative protease
MEMMVSEFCLVGASLGQGREKVQSSDHARKKCCGVCHEREYFLQDRLSYRFPLAMDRECRMHIFNARKLNLITELNKIAEIGLCNIRLELPRATENQARETVKIFKDLWTEAAAGKIISEQQTQAALHKLECLYPEGFTKGHFHRGVLA